MDWNALVDQLSGKATDITTQAFALALTRNHALGVMDTAVAIIVLVLAILVLIFIARCIKDSDAMIILGCLAAVLFVIASSFSYYATLRLMSPKWMAIQDLIGLIKN